MLHKHLMLHLVAMLIAVSLSAQIQFADKAAAIRGFQTNKTTDDKVYACFFLVDEYMNEDRYDSAQYWLNIIYNVYKIRKPSLFNYLIQARQAEVYYYNNLMELGLESANQSLAIASAMNDSLLIADANNFVGLFYTSMDSCSTAIPFFEQGLRFITEPPYPAKYGSLTMPHHLYGNLAEALYKTGQYRPSLQAAHASLQGAAAVNMERGIAIASIMIGQSYERLGQLDSAQRYLQQAKSWSQQSKDPDVELLTFTGLAMVAHARGLETKAFQTLDEGFQFLQDHRYLNILFSRVFIKDALGIYGASNNQLAINKAYQHLLMVDSVSRKYNSRQVQNLIRNAINADKQLLNSEIAKARQDADLANTRLWMAIGGLGLLLIIGGTIFYIYRQRLKVASWRNGLSQDLHDEVGGTLSGIGFMSELSQQKIKQGEWEEANRNLDKIIFHSKETIEKMSDIVWTVNPKNDNLEKVVEKLLHFALQLAASREMEVKQDIDKHLLREILDVNKRKHLYLIGKEAISNAVKHSGATHIFFSFKEYKKKHQLLVMDNGKGFDVMSPANGNGLKNIRHRVKELGAHLELESAPGEGTKLIVTF